MMLSSCTKLGGIDYFQAAFKLQEALSLSSIGYISKISIIPHKIIVGMQEYFECNLKICYVEPTCI